MIKFALTLRGADERALGELESLVLSQGFILITS